MCMVSDAYLPGGTILASTLQCLSKMNPSEKFNNTPSVSDITRSSHTLPKFTHWSFSSNLVLLSVMNPSPLSGSIHSTHCSPLGAGTLSLSAKGSTYAKYAQYLIYRPVLFNLWASSRPYHRVT